MSLARALSPAIREIRLLCCQTGAASTGTRLAVLHAYVPTAQALTEPTRRRQFILSAYPVLKKHNPDLPVMIREAHGTPARAFARFGSYLLAQISGLSLRT